KFFTSRVSGNLFAQGKHDRSAKRARRAAAINRHRPHAGQVARAIGKKKPPGLRTTQAGRRGCRRKVRGQDYGCGAGRGTGAGKGTVAGGDGWTGGVTLTAGPRGPASTLTPPGWTFTLAPPAGAVAPVVEESATTIVPCIPLCRSHTY